MTFLYPSSWAGSYFFPKSITLLPVLSPAWLILSGHNQPDMILIDQILAVLLLLHSPPLYSCPSSLPLCSAVFHYRSSSAQKQALLESQHDIRLQMFFWSEDILMSDTQNKTCKLQKLVSESSKSLLFVELEIVSCNVVLHSQLHLWHTALICFCFLWKIYFIF